jgi:mono/diheme cytochrome c family protein
MSGSRLLICLILIGGLALPSWADETPDLPPAAERQIDFHKDVAPILLGSCVACHAGKNDDGGYQVSTRESVLAGGDSGPSVVEGNSAESLLIHLVAQQDPDRIMPAKGPKLTAAQVGVLRAWIDQGLKWEEGFVIRPKYVPAELKPRKPELPSAESAGSEHPIDRLLAPYLAASGHSSTELVDDRTFARRAYLDVIGLLPSPEDVDEFCADSAPDKRAQLVDQLLADRQQYATHWLSFWNDALRNDYQGTGYIDGGRQQISQWLFTALGENKPYHQFVRELVTGAPGAEGFIKGITWRGVVNASQVPEMQAAQNVSQVFLGVNLKCASCHDSFINDWTLHDAYGLAGVFAESQLEVHRCDQPKGEYAPLKFLYPELGTIDSQGNREVRLQQLADLLTHEQNGRLARTIVNRLWGKFLGRAIIEPVDDMDNTPWNADLLDWLAVDLAEHGYDLTHTLRLILTSRAYQMPAVDRGERDAETFIFHGPVVKRLNAEQFSDALSQITHNWPEKPDVEMPQLGGEPAVKDVGVRAALKVSNPLVTAMGRPNREQVVTSRPQTATTLEALELTNGQTLADQLAKGGAYWQSQSLPREELIQRLYREALGREPRPEEQADAESLLGETATAEGIQDLLWSIIMSPEFQLVY